LFQAARGCSLANNELDGWTKPNSRNEATKLQEKIMKKTISILAIAGFVLALAPAAQAVIIAHTGFEEPANGASSFTPGVSDTEIGFSVPSGGNFVVSTTAVITGSQSFRMKTAPLPKGYVLPGVPVTFDTVVLSGFSGVVVYVDTNVINSGYEYMDGGPTSDGGEAYRVFLDLNDGSTTTTVTVFDSWEDIGDLDIVDEGPTLTYTYDIPDGTVSATASVFWAGNSGSEGVDIDNLSFDGTAVPEPATMSLLAIGGLALLRRRRRA
jgi:hypothetical protein